MALATISRSRGSSTRWRRCSTTARASGLVKRRSGSVISIVSLLPVWPARSLAMRVSSTRMPAQG